VFGLYRLILAILVALSHYGLIFAGFNPGQWSVICFYVLSGFLMDRQFKKLSAVGGVSAFYVDRALRIFPLYLIVVCLGMAIAPIPWRDFWINASLFPLNYDFFTGVPLIISPAWSLACEAHFYLVLPLLVLLPLVWLRSLAVCSLVFFSISPFIADGGFWAYAGLPGILFTFLSGILINRQDWKPLRALYPSIGLLLLLFLLSKVVGIHITSGININVCIGYLAAVPATIYLGRLSPKVRWDQALGLLSFPLFLIHTPALLLCQRYFPHLDVAGLLGFALLSSALLVVLVEKPFDYLRYRARKLPRPGKDTIVPAQS
jgi:peptidoglycan/LPS O-acetylase OafA/YrhL